MATVTKLASTACDRGSDCDNVMKLRSKPSGINDGGGANDDSRSLGSMSDMLPCTEPGARSIDDDETDYWKN